MLRIYFLQHWFNLSDPAAEEALYDSPALLALRPSRRQRRLPLGEVVLMADEIAEPLRTIIIIISKFRRRHPRSDLPILRQTPLFAGDALVDELPTLTDI